MKTPRFCEVENLPPYQFSQLNAFSRSTSFHGSPEPRIVTGKLDRVEGDVVLAHELDVADVVRALVGAPPALPVAAGRRRPTRRSTPMYSIGASNQT